MYFKTRTEIISQNPFFFKDGFYLLYSSLEDALKENSNLNFLTNKIDEKKYWAEDIDSFVKEFLLTKRLPVKPLLELDGFEYELVLKDRREWLFLKDNQIYSLDISYANYFNEEVILEDELFKLELKLKTIGYLTPIKLLIDKLKEYFDVEYNYFLLQIYNFIKVYEVKYSQELFSNIVLSKKYLDEIKIRNSIEGFTYERDKEGKYLTINYSDSVTGRLYGSELQTLPKDKKHLLIAQDDFYLIEFDFVSFEFNILLDILKLPKPIDPHLEVLNFLGLDLDRSIGKRINYAFIFGMNINKIVLTIHEEFNVLIDKEKLSAYPPFKKKLEIENNDGLITTYFGRPISPEKSYALLNNFIQGTAADIFFNKFLKISKILTGESKIITQNHDSILLEVSKKDIEKNVLLKTIKRILEEPMGGLSFKVDMKYGKNWGEMK